MDVPPGEEVSQPFTQKTNLPEPLLHSTTICEDIPPQEDSTMAEVTEDTAAPAVEHDTNEQTSQPTTAIDSHSDEMNVDSKDEEPSTRGASEEVEDEDAKDSDIALPEYLPDVATSSIEPTIEEQVVDHATHIESQPEGLEDDIKNENMDPQGELAGMAYDQDAAVPSIEHGEAVMEPIPQVMSNSQPMKSLFVGLQPKPHLFAKSKPSDTMDQSMSDAIAPVFDSISQQLSDEDVPAPVPENDSAWMENLEDGEDIDDSLELSDRIQFLHAEKATRKLSRSETMELKRLESQVQQAENRRAAAHRGHDEGQENGDDDDDGMFVSQWRQASSPIEEGDLSGDDLRNPQEASPYSLSPPIKQEEEVPQKRQLRKRTIDERKDSTEDRAPAKKQRRKPARNYSETMARYENYSIHE